MSLLIDKAPTTVNIGGTDISINSDFRTAVLFEQMMFDDDFPDDMKGINAVRLFYPVMPNDIDTAIDRLVQFYSCGKQQNQSKSKSQSQNRCYDFEYDDDYIFAAFMQTYHIDLEKTKYLHWWKFSAMFRALPETCEIVKIMGYRSIKIDSKMSDSERRFYNKMKKLHALPMSRTDAEKITEIENMLMRKK